MSNETQFTDALRGSAGPLCDDCITTSIGWNNRQQANQVGTRLAAKGRVARDKGVCPACGKRT